MEQGAVLIGLGLDRVSEPEFARWEAGLPAASQLRASGLRDRRRRHFVASRYWLQELFLALTGEGAAVCEQELGAPLLATKGVCVSLSHSHTAIMVGFSRLATLGVDIEWEKPRDFLRSAEAYFHPQEYQRLAAQSRPEGLREFYRLWVAKEALAKASGTGLGSAELAMNTVKQLSAAEYWNAVVELTAFQCAVVHCCHLSLPVYSVDVSLPWCGAASLEQVRLMG